MLHSFRNHCSGCQTPLPNDVIHKYFNSGRKLSQFTDGNQFFATNVHNLENILHTHNQPNFLLEIKLLHAHIIQTQLQHQQKTYLSLWNRLVTLYVNCGDLADARTVFNHMQTRDVVSWTAMISAYVREGHAEEALVLFHRMTSTGIEPNHFTFSCILPACAALGSRDDGEQIHERIIRSGLMCDIFVSNALVDFYAKCGSLEDARRVFDKMPQRDVVSWNAMVSGYAREGCIDKALEIFNAMPYRNVVSWSAIIAGYVQNGIPVEALKLYRRMQEDGIKPNSNIFGTLVSSCTALGNLDWGVEVHGRIITSGFESELSVGNVLLDMYAKCGRVEFALKVFDKISQRNVVSWTSMIAGYAQNGHFGEAMLLFRQMQQFGMKGNSVTLVAVLPVCGYLGALKQGMEIHGAVIRSGFAFDIFVGNALVDMYAKCGSLEMARNVFDKMSQRDVVSWTVIIGGYAYHGHVKEAAELFEQMQQIGVIPNDVTFLAVLTACCHGGLLDEGQKYFDHMIKCCRIEPAMEHYGCMVDLLGRCGHLIEAENFINQMPFKADVTVWGPLLGACAIHKNIEVGQRVAEKLFQLDPTNSTPYVVLSNLYAAFGRWDDIERVRKMMKDRMVRKKPGCSWIEINKNMHTFLVGHKSHEKMQKINENLQVDIVHEGGMLCV